MITGSETGIQKYLTSLDSGLRRNDERAGKLISYGAIEVSFMIKLGAPATGGGADT